MLHVRRMLDLGLVIIKSVLENYQWQTSFSAETAPKPLKRSIAVAATKEATISFRKTNATFTKKFLQITHALWRHRKKVHSIEAEEKR